MLATYKAILKGNHLEWSDSPPQLPLLEEGVPVQVTILPDSHRAKESRGKQVAAILSQLAEIKAFSGINNPVEWQRAIRQDRPLPGREQ
jgi:hypothetical protein